MAALMSMRILLTALVCAIADAGKPQKAKDMQELFGMSDEKWGKFTEYATSDPQNFLTLEGDEIGLTARGQEGAATLAQGLCENGFHVPTLDDMHMDAEAAEVLTEGEGRNEEIAGSYPAVTG